MMSCRIFSLGNPLPCYSAMHTAHFLNYRQTTDPLHYHVLWEHNGSWEELQPHNKQTHTYSLCRMLSVSFVKYMDYFSTCMVLSWEHLLQLKTPTIRQYAHVRACYEVLEYTSGLWYIPESVVCLHSRLWKPTLLAIPLGCMVGYSCRTVDYIWLECVMQVPVSDSSLLPNWLTAQMHHWPNTL